VTRGIALILLLFLLSCAERNYDPPSGYKVTLFLKGGIFADNTSDRVHGGILQPTAMKNVPRLIPSEPYLRWDLPFAAWNTDPYGLGEFYVPDSIIDRDVTLYAVYGTYVYDEYTLKDMECGNPFRIYVLMNDINAGVLLPICPDPDRPFRGKFIGNGYTISYTVGTPIPAYGGLFAYMDNSTVYNLNINTNLSVGSSFAGGLAGYMSNSTANRVSVRGNIRASVAGGIVGEAYLSRIINSAYGDIEGRGTETVTSSGTAAGGLIGHATGSNIVNSTVDGTVSVTSASGSAGGIVGMMDRTDITNCLHSGKVTGTGASVNLGGLAGSMNNAWILSSYANSAVLAPETGSSAAGGLVGNMADSGITKSAAVGIMVRGGNAGRIAGKFSTVYYDEAFVDNYAREDMLVNYKPVVTGDVNGTSLPLVSMRKNHDFFAEALGWDTYLHWILPPHYEYPRLEWEILPRFIEINFPEELSEIDERWEDEYGEIINEYSRGWFVLMRDIDMEGRSWRRIGSTDNPYEGLLDGNGYTIKNLNADFFGTTNGLRIYDLNIINATAVDGGIVADSAVGGRFENITATGSVRFYSNGGGILGSVTGDVLINRCFFAGELLTRITGSGSNYAGGLVGTMNGGFLLNSGTMGIAGARSGTSVSSGTSAQAAAGGLVGNANDIIAVNNYSSMDLYATGGSASNAGGMFGNISNSTLINGYAAGDIYAASRYHTSASKLTPSAGGIAGNAANSDIRNAAYLGKNLTTEYYDVLGTGGAEGYAAGVFAQSTGTVFSNIYSDPGVNVSSDNTAGEWGTPVDMNSLTESFYTDGLGWNFDTVWRTLNPGDIRDANYPVFKRERDIAYPPADGDEWYWYSVRKYYEDF
jgi:hypothetical protein